MRDLPPATLDRVAALLREAFTPPKLAVESLHNEQARNIHAAELGKQSVIEYVEQAAALSRRDRQGKQEDDDSQEEA